MKLNLLVIAFLCASSAMTGCSSNENDKERRTPLTVDTVNELIENSFYHGPEYIMTCGSGALNGCFVYDGCTSSSGYYSDLIVYSIEETEIKAFTITYDNGRCAGKPGIHPTSWSRWSVEYSNIDTFMNRADMTLRLERYSDGFIFDSNKPVKGIDYESDIWIDKNGTNERLCLSSDIIDPHRPLKFMDTIAEPLDPNHCAVELSN